MGDRLDWFLATIFSGEAKLEETDKNLIADHAELFLRAQGSLTWSEWQLLSPFSRIAFQVASERLERERAERVAGLVLSALAEATEPVEEAQPGG